MARSLDGFETWMRLVNTEVNVRTGLSVYDLQDMPFADMYEDEYTPSEAAEESLTEAGW